MNALRHSPRSLGRQRGIVLATGLLLLVLVTLVVLAAARSGRLQAIMSSNTRDRDLAFQAAEAALLNGEERLIFEFHTIFMDSANSSVENVGTGLLNRNASTLNASARTAIIVKATRADYWVSSASSGATAGSTPMVRSTAASRSRPARRSRAWTSSPVS